MVSRYRQCISEHITRLWVRKSSFSLEKADIDDFVEENAAANHKHLGIEKGPSVQMSDSKNECADR
jgi:hypothetical protein